MLGLRNRLAYPSLLTLAALDAFNRQVLMIPTDYHSPFPRELRPLLRADPNHEVDALMASACAHSRQFVSNDITLNARLRFLAQRGFPVPQPITFTEFTDLVS